jgi:hypothetical protein
MHQISLQDEHASEVFQKFSEYKAYADLQTGRKMKRIRSDRGDEYLTDKLKQLTVREGIVNKPWRILQS